MIITRTPLRITLCGGGTDLPSYYKINGGKVVTMAIDKYIYITLKEDNFDELCKLRYSEIEIANNIALLKNSRARMALTRHDLTAVEINTCADLSSKSGLGSSGSFLVGLLNAIRQHLRKDACPSVLAEEACEIEIEDLKEPVGKQDQYIAAFGGIRLLEIDTNGTVAVSSFELNIDDLIANMRVYALNVYRNASDILSDQSKMGTTTKSIMDDINALGAEQMAALSTGDLTEYGKTLDIYWSLKQKLSPKISLRFVDELYKRAKEEYGILGGKIIGAGGGGFLMLYSEDNHGRLDDFMSSHGCKRLKYGVDTKGSILLGNY